MQGGYGCPTAIAGIAFWPCVSAISGSGAPPMSAMSDAPVAWLMADFASLNSRAWPASSEHFFDLAFTVACMRSASCSVRKIVLAWLWEAISGFWAVCQRVQVDIKFDPGKVVLKNDAR